MLKLNYYASRHNMAAHQNHATENPVSENDASTGTMGLAIKVAVGAFVMIMGIVLLANFAIGSRPLGAGNEKANSPEGIAARIAPLATFVVDETKGPVAGAPVAMAATGAAPVAAASAVVAAAIPSAAPQGGLALAGGEGTYKSSCAACHSAGIAGAPKSGDKAAWSPRIAQGKETLYKHAIGGFQGKGGVMPAKGGNSLLSDADVKAAVDYMVALNK
jgi:cytochrome c5